MRDQEMLVHPTRSFEAEGKMLRIEDARLPRHKGHEAAETFDPQSGPAIRVVSRTET